MAQQIARKTIYVNRDIQGRIVGRLAKYWILYHLGLWTILLLIEFFQHIIGALLMGEVFVPRNFCIQFVSEHWFVLVAPVILFPAIVWDMLQLTHKVAGPLVRYCRALQQLAAGNRVEKIQLRKGDLLTEFQDVFNEFLASEHCQSNQVAKAGLRAKPQSREELILDTISTIGVELQDAKRPAAHVAIR